MTNQDISPENWSLPDIEEAVYHEPEKKYLWQRITASTFTLVFLLGAYALAWYLEWIDFYYLAIAGMVTLYALLVMNAIFATAKLRYAIRELDVTCRKGWLYQKDISVPIAMLQHVSIERGPVELMFKLATIKLFTAGGAGSDLSIPGLSYERAMELKAYFSNRIND